MIFFFRMIRITTERNKTHMPYKRKFVPRDKMSKKDRKELDNQKRIMWGFSPTERIKQNKKLYDRERLKRTAIQFGD